MMLRLRYSVHRNQLKILWMEGNNKTITKFIICNIKDISYIYIYIYIRLFQIHECPWIEIKP